MTVPLRRSAPPLLWLALLLFAAPVDARSIDAERARFDAWLQTVATAPEPEAAAAALELQDVERWLPPDEVIERYEVVADERRPDLAADLLDYRRVRLLEALGRIDERDALLEEAGYLTAWSVVGPFPNDGMAGLRAQYPPEIDGITSDPMDGKVVPVQWRALGGVSESGYLDLADVVQPAHDAVAYVAADIEAPRARDAVLGLAVDGAYRVWLNGAPIAEQPDHLGGFAIRDEIAVRLERGSNQLLIKIAADDGPLGLHARLRTPEGTSLAALARPATAPGVAAAPTDAWPRPTSPSERLAPAGRLPRDLLTVAYVVHGLQPADPSEPWRLGGVEPAGPEYTVHDHLRAAALEREHWRSMLWLDAAERGADDPWIALAWIDAHRSEMGAAPRLAAADRLRQLLAEPDAPATAWAVWADMLREQGFDQASGEVRRALYEAAPHALAALWPMVSSAIANEWRAELPTLYAALRRVDARSIGPVEGLLEQAVTAQDRAAARAEIARLRAVRPLARGPLELAARERLGAGAIDEAIDAWTQAIALCPGSAEAYEARGRLRLEAGDLEAAAADWDAALARAPQNARLREELAAIRPADADAFGTWRVGDERLRELAEQAPSGASAAVTLVDQRVVELRPNGLATAWTQLAWRVDTRAGADQLRVQSVTYTPDAELVELQSLRVLAPDGTTTEAWEVDDYNPQQGPAAMYFDARVRAWLVNQLEPGDLLVLEYTVDDVAFRNLFDDYFGDLWFAQSAYPTSMARYAIRYPDTRTLYDNRDTVSLGSWSDERDGEMQLLRFEAFDVPAVPPESSAPGATEIAAHVSVSTAESWEELADWYWDLVEDQLVVSPDMEATVAELIDGAESTQEIVERIYAYVVRNTRYVGLEFGIHGYKPYRTTECFARRFGDCKDTASLLKVMLGLAGVDAHLVLVRTRDRGRIDPGTPSLAVFNHAIAWVPELDWFLDGTAGFSGAAELPPGDQGASALLVLDGDGGQFRELPVLAATASEDETVATIDLRGDDAEASIQMRWSGAFAAGGRRMIEAASRLDERLEDQLGTAVPGVAVRSVDASDPGAIDEPVTFDVVAYGGTWFARQGDEVILHPFIEDGRLVQRLAGAEVRELPLAFPHRFAIVQELRWTLPADWSLTTPPPSASGESPFGMWSVEVERDGEALVARSRFELRAVQISAEEYPAFRAFVAEADAAMDRVVRLESGEGES